MVVRHVLKSGFKVHGPPYTKAEEAEFYRRNAGGPKTVFAPKQDKPAAPPPAPAPHPPQHPQGKRRAPRHPRRKT